MREGNVFTSVCLSTGELDIPDPMCLLEGWVGMSGPMSLWPVGWGVRHVWSHVPSEGMGMYRYTPGRYPLEVPPGRYTSQRYTPGRYSPQKVHPQCWHLVVATEVGGTHPTAMLSCFFFLLFSHSTDQRIRLFTASLNFSMDVAKSPWDVLSREAYNVIHHHSLCWFTCVYCYREPFMIVLML